MTDEKCQQVLWNLLELFDAKDGLPASVLVSELMQTKRCDGLFDKHTADSLKTLRSDYSGAIGSPAVLTRVDAGEATAHDEMKCLKAIAHYRSHTNNKLFDGLQWWKKLQFQTLYKAERNIAAIGIVGLGLGGSRAMIRIARASVDYMKTHK